MTPPIPLGIIAASRRVGAPAPATSFVLLDNGSRANQPASGYVSWDTSAPSLTLWVQHPITTPPRYDADGQSIDAIVADMIAAGPFTMLVEVDGALALTLTGFRWDDQSAVSRWRWDSPAVTTPWPRETRLTFRPQIGA